MQQVDVHAKAERLVGRTLGGQYRLVRLLRTPGGFSHVYEAQHEALGIRVCVKVLRQPDDARFEDYCAAHFEAEARLGFLLRHPGIVRVFDFRREANVEYIVMEWVEGRTLQQLTDGRPLPWRRATSLIIRACDAVAAMHGAGFLHRDVKPDNVMVVDEEGTERVVLIDLGLARHLPLHEPLLDALEAPTTSPAFTPGFAPPEIYGWIEHVRAQRSAQRKPDAVAAVEHRSPFSPQSDVFALGITLYQLVVGRRPWAEHVEIAVGVQPRPPSEHGADLPPALEAVIMKAIAVRQEARYTSVGELSAALQRVLLPAAPPATATGPLELGRPHPRGDRARPGVLAGLAGLALVAGGLAMMRSSTSAPSALQLLAEDEAPPVPVPMAMHLPDALEVELATPPKKETAPASEPARQRPSVLQLLRRCPGAPRGPVVLEVAESRLQTIDLASPVVADPWHRCAADVAKRLGNGTHLFTL